MKRGRPRLSQKAKIVQIKLRLYEGIDDDLTAFFTAIPFGLRTVLVKQALRSGIANSLPVAEKTDELIDALDSLVG